jgi:hypothetical protein
MLGAMRSREHVHDAGAARVAHSLAAMRTAIGIAAMALPGPLLRSWGFPRSESRAGEVKALLRVLAGRDLVLGVATLAVRDEPAALRAMVKASAALDAGDTAVSLGLAVLSADARRPAIAWTLVGIPFSALGWRVIERL